MHRLWEQCHLACTRSHSTPFDTWCLSADHCATTRWPCTGHRTCHHDLKRVRNWGTCNLSSNFDGSMFWGGPKTKWRRWQQCSLSKCTSLLPEDMYLHSPRAHSSSGQNCTRTCKGITLGSFIQWYKPTASTTTTTQQILWKRLWHTPKFLQVSSVAWMWRGRTHRLRRYVVYSPWSKASMWSSKSSEAVPRSCWMAHWYSSSLGWWNWPNTGHHDLPGTTYTALHTVWVHFGASDHWTSSTSWPRCGTYLDSRFEI